MPLRKVVQAKHSADQHSRMNCVQGSQCSQNKHWRVSYQMDRNTSIIIHTSEIFVSIVSHNGKISTPKKREFENLAKIIFLKVCQEMHTYPLLHSPLISHSENLALNCAVQKQIKQVDALDLKFERQALTSTPNIFTAGLGFCTP